MKTLTTLFAAAALCIPAIAGSSQESDVSQRLQNSANVLQQMTGANGIPRTLLDQAQCVVVIPGMKQGAFIAGAKYGAGFATCRTNGSNASGTTANMASNWSSPAGVQIEGGSIGAQIGAKKTDIVMLLMDQKARNELLQANVTLGATASIEAGPVGRAVSTDHADILVYTRSNGAMAKLSVNGSNLKEDNGANQSLYGKKVSNQQILDGNVSASNNSAAQQFLQTVHQEASGTGSSNTRNR